jgi:hypothetical protein
MAQPVQRTSIVRETNTFLRTVVYGGLVGLLGFGAWEAKSFLDDGKQAIAEKEREISVLKDQQQKLELEKKKLEVEIARVNTALKFLKLEHRLAKLEILDQTQDPERPARTLTKVRFTELGPKGEEVGAPTTGTLVGKEIYIDAPTIRFKDDFVEQGDLLRGRSICRFRRIYGDHQAPNEGLSLDRPPESPGDLSEFERDLWKQFWDLANDAKQADQLGVQSAQGGGPAMAVKKGATYHIELRASGGLPSMKAIEQKQPTP